MKKNTSLASFGLALILFTGFSAAPAISAEQYPAANSDQLQSVIKEAISDGYDISVEESKISLGGNESLELSKSSKSSTLEIVLDDSSPSALALAVEELTDKGLAPKKTTTSAPSLNALGWEPYEPIGGENVTHYCSVGDNVYSDQNGTFNIRYNCPYSVVNWQYKTTPALNSIITSYITELGMEWSKNGNVMSANASHYVLPGYAFHGTLNPVVHGDLINYTDEFQFSVNVGGFPGTGVLKIRGIDIRNYDW